MRNSLVTAFVLAALVALPCFAGDYTKSGGSGDQFGMGFPEIPDSADMVTTYTRQHRWGNQTGIGSSTMQTTAATTAEMPLVNYKPTSISPALTPVPKPFESGNATFSERMTSPAFSPLVSTPSTFSTGMRINPGSFEGALPSSLTTSGYSLFGPMTNLGEGALSGRRSVGPSVNQFDKMLEQQPAGGMSP